MKSLLWSFLIIAFGVEAASWSAQPLAAVAIYPEFRAIAMVKPINEAKISAEIGGLVAAMPLRVGDTAIKGAELVRIDAGEYRIAVDRAAAQASLVDSRISLAEAQLAQARALAGRGYISEDALRVRETELAVLTREREAARHALAGVRLQLTRTMIRAPFDGIVRERLASVGDLAQPGTPLLVLMSTDETEVHARIPVAQVDDLKRSREVRLWIGETGHALTLARVVEAVEAAGQAQIAVFIPASPVAPGLAGEIRWRSSEPHIPAEFIVSVRGRLGVWVDDGGTAAFRPIDKAVAGRAVAAGGLGDAQIIVEGRLSLGVTPADAHEVAK